MRTLDSRSAEVIRLAPEVVAERAGLVHVTDAVPGITRERAWRRWRYRRPDGAVVTDPDERARFEGPTTLTFEFRAKSGKEQRVRLGDPLLVTVVRACSDLPGQELSRCVDDGGRVVDVGSTDVNAYLRAVTHAVFTAKDYRTRGGTRVPEAHVDGSLTPAFARARSARSEAAPLQVLA